MATSDGLACVVCGELPAIDRIDWGCVVCNRDKERAAHLPEVPVSTGPADRADGVGCLQHGIIGCERCGKLWARHSLTGGWQRAEGESGWASEESRSGGGLTLAVIVLLFLLLAAGCLWVAIALWPAVSPR